MEAGTLSLMAGLVILIYALGLVRTMQNPTLAIGPLAAVIILFAASLVLLVGCATQGELEPYGKAQAHRAVRCQHSGPAPFNCAVYLYQHGRWARQRQ